MTDRHMDGHMDMGMDGRTHLLIEMRIIDLVWEQRVTKVGPVPHRE